MTKQKKTTKSKRAGRSSMPAAAPDQAEVTPPNAISEPAAEVKKVAKSLKSHLNGTVNIVGHPKKKI